MTSVAPDLTPEQAAAIAVGEGAYLLTAPPGSGKTEVLVRRIERLLAESGGETFRVLALTFTTRAAENLSRRIERDIGDEAWRLTAGTFHHFCLELLRSYGELVAVPPDVTVFADVADRAELLVRGLEEDGHDPNQLGLDDTGIRRILTDIDLLRTRLVPPEAAPHRTAEGTQVRLDVAYLAYERVMDHVGGIDFTGMLARAHQLLTESVWTARHYRSMYRYILIDEGQDLNLAQYEVLRALCGEEHRNVFMVADENQSIFGFNGASPKFVTRFGRDFAATRLPLTSNFRCGGEIVEAANRLADHFTSDTPVPPMSTACQAKGMIEAWAVDDEDEEGEVVAEWIEQLLADGLDGDILAPGEAPAVPAEEIGILGRTRYALEGVAESLQRREQPFVLRTGDTRLFDSPGWRRVYLALRLLANPRDFPVRQRLWMELASADMANMGDPWDAPDSDAELLDLLAKADGTGEMGELSEALVHRAKDTIADDALIDRLLAANPPEELDEESAAVWLDDQEEFARCWKRHVGSGTTSSFGLPGFLGALSRLQRVTVDEDGVRLLTVHAAKGLEFRIVVLVGMNQGTFPHYRSLDSAPGVDEERRNAFVAITRAGRALVLTRPRTRHTRYGPRRQDRSQFLEEMGLGERHP